MNFSFIKSKEIDYAKWNKTINESQEPLIYAYSFYLDSICDNWAALINDDYSFVIPLPYFKLFNRYNFYQPQFIPKLGYFAAFIPDNIFIDELFEQIPEKISSISIELNKTVNVNNNFSLIKKKYYSIDLNSKYTKLYERFSQRTKNISKIDDYYFIINQTSPNEIINFLNTYEFFKKNNKNYDLLRRIISLTTIKNVNTIITAYSKQNEIIGISFFINSKYSSDLIFLYAIDDDANIIFKMINLYLNNFANKAITLNFEWTQSKNLQILLNEIGAFQNYRYKINYNTYPRFYKLLSKIISD